MILKKSKYTRIAKVIDDVFLLYNIASGSECLISSQEKVWLESEDYSDTPFFGELYNLGILVDARVDEESCLELERKINAYSKIRTDFGLVIAPTMDCNARCFYCYENETRKNLYMDEATKETLINYILRNAKGKKKVFLSWFGGEPLLCSRLIREVSKPVIAYCQENDIEYEAELTTNGFYIDRILDSMSELCIQDTQITLDGFADEYEARKKYVDGTNSWNKAVSNIFDASISGNHITIRMNFDKRNIASIKEATSYLLGDSRWNNNISIYYYPLEPCGECIDESIFYSEDEYESALTDLYLDLYHLHYYDTHRRALDFTRMSLPCYGGTLATVAVDYSGSLYQCQHLLCREEFAIGNLTDGVIINRTVLDWYDGSLPKSCRGCDVLPLCQGGCVTKRNLGQDKYLCHMSKYRISIIEKIKTAYYKAELLNEGGVSNDRY